MNTEPTPASSVEADLTDDEQLAAASGGTGDWVDRNFSSPPDAAADAATATVLPVTQRAKAPKWID